MSPDDEFTLELPATALAAPVARAMAAAVAMVHDIVIDDITDLRLAVDEACSTLHPLAVAGTTMRCTIQVRPAELHATFEVIGTSADALPDPDSVDLHILRSLAAHVDAHAEPARDDTARLTLRLALTRTTT